jgi:hypothetical protein
VDIELIASLVAFAALVIVWMGAPAGKPQPSVHLSPARASVEA